MIFTCYLYWKLGAMAYTQRLFAPSPPLSLHCSCNQQREGNKALSVHCLQQALPKLKDNSMTIIQENKKKEVYLLISWNSKRAGTGLTVYGCTTASITNKTLSTSFTEQTCCIVPTLLDKVKPSILIQKHISPVLSWHSCDTLQLHCEWNIATSLNNNYM